MDRNEVLERLDRMGDETNMQMVSMEGLGQWARAASLRVDTEVFRAAAEIIRESGWRPIAEAPEGPLACGKHLPSGKWISYHFFSAAHAAKEGYTHYLLEPAPPAREVSNDGE